MYTSRWNTEYLKCMYTGMVGGYNILSVKKHGGKMICIELLVCLICYYMSKK